MASQTPSASDKYQITSEKESIIEKDWAAGSHKPVKFMDFYATSISNVSHGAIEYAPALEKIVDEVITNAIDYFVTRLTTAERVTKIDVNFNPDGSCRVFNNGPGIEIEIHDQSLANLGEELYIPTLIFGKLYQGSNRVKPADSIVGGTNGMGAKITNIHSSEFTVETVRDGKYFKQTWTNCMSVAGEPIVKPTPRNYRTGNHTTILFQPDYRKYDLPEATLTNQPAFYETFLSVVRMRMLLAAAYVGYSSKLAGVPNAVVSFNGELLETSSAKAIASVMFPDRPIVSFMAYPDLNSNYRSPAEISTCPPNCSNDTRSEDSSKPTAKLTAKQKPRAKTPAKARGKTAAPAKAVDAQPRKLQTENKAPYPWDIAVVATADVVPKRQISIVNGMVVRKGPHIDIIRDQIVDEICRKCKGAVTKDRVKKSIFIVINSKIPFALTQWQGQRKDEMVTHASAFPHYVITPAIMKQIVASVEPIIAGLQIRTAKIDYADYLPAECIKRGKLPWLMACEGSSAISQARESLAKNGLLGDISLISTGGVPISSRKNCTLIGDKNVPRKNFIENKFMKAFVDIVGLKYGTDYDPETLEGKESLKKVKIRGFIANVDQDHDGKGQILGLLLSTIVQYWPGIIKAGLVKFYQTPIKWIYPKAAGAPVVIYTDRQYKEWTATADTAKYNDPKYCKGLATHSEKEATAMYKNIFANLYTYVLDALAEYYIDIYYGIEPDKRKHELSRARYYPTDEELLEIERTQRIPVSHHIITATREYQEDNIDRKLSCFVDGQNQSGRKILDTTIKFYSKKNDPTRASSLAGKVVTTTHYGHGESSLHNSIAMRAQIFCGARQLPLLLPDSMFGSRDGGGKDMGAARYTECYANLRLINVLFPWQFYYMLMFNYEGNTRVEPVSFVPIIPLAVLESDQLPGTGWKLELWARDVLDLIRYVRAVVSQNAPNRPLPELKLCTYAGSPHEWKGSIRFMRGHEYTFGCYKISGDDTAQSPTVITVTELPLRSWTANYITSLKKKSDIDGTIIDDYKNNSISTCISIEITLKPGSMRILEDAASDVADGVEEYFNLYSVMHHHINLISPDKVVHSFPTYSSVIAKWYPYCHSMYVKRTTKQRVAITAEMTMLDNKIRYIENSDSLALAKMKSSQMVETLAREGYVRVDAARISMREFGSPDELKVAIYDPETATFNYLLNMSDLKKSEEKLAKLRATRAKLQSELDNMNAEVEDFPGQNMWLHELRVLEDTIREGIPTNWEYDNFGKYKYF